MEVHCRLQCSSARYCIMLYPVLASCLHKLYMHHTDHCALQMTDDCLLTERTHWNNSSFGSATLTLKVFLHDCVPIPNMSLGQIRAEHATSAQYTNSQQPESCVHIIASVLITTWVYLCCKSCTVGDNGISFDNYQCVKQTV